MTGILKYLKKLLNMRVKNEEHICQADELDYMLSLKPSRKRKSKWQKRTPIGDYWLETGKDKYGVILHNKEGDTWSDPVRAMSHLMKEILSERKAFGNCIRCYGKGYSTEMIGKTIARGDFIGQKDRVLSRGGVMIHFCSCGRGKQLANILKKKKPRLLLWDYVFEDMNI